MQRGYLIDMDGVIYRGGELISGAGEFIGRLLQEQIPFLFLTNNSQRTCRDIATKLNRLGIPVEESHIYTCAMSTAGFVSTQKPEGTAFVIGEGGLLNALHAVGYSVVDHSPDYVIVGETRTVNLEVLETAVQLILDGAKLLATNLDPNCPTRRGIRPGCGATVSYLETATGARAMNLGKPSPIMMRAARKRLMLATSQTIMIGDTMETDILGGIQMGYRTILTLTGSTRVEDVKRYPYQPDCIVKSVDELNSMRFNLSTTLPAGNKDDDTVVLRGAR